MRHVLWKDGGFAAIVVAAGADKAERFAAEESEGATLFCVALTPPSPVGRGFFTFYFARSGL